MALRLVVCSLLLCATAWPQASRPVGRLLDADLAPKLERMRTLMREGLDREKPHAESIAGFLVRPKRTMFRGSYDRHSNIAAHWALLSWARRVSDDVDVRALSGRFTAARLRSEREFIARGGGQGEIGRYADAWLLLLLRELDRVLEDPAALVLCRELAAETEARVLDEIDLCPAPGLYGANSRPEMTSYYRSRWSSGEYDSLLWPTVVLQLAPSPLAERRDRLDRLRADRIKAARTFAARGGRNNTDFLWPDSLLWLSDAVAPRPPGPLPPYTLPPYVAPPPRITLLNCHALGREIVKAWPLAVRAGAGDAPARKELNDRLRACLEREDAWNGPFDTVSHWVPQFVYFAVWLSDARP